MPKLNNNVDVPVASTVVADSGIEVLAVPIPYEFLVASILLSGSLHWNGATVHAGSIIGNIPMVQARQMVKDHLPVRIIGSEKIESLRRKEGIEHEVPAGLGPDFEAIHTVPGQRSSVFVNRKEMEALQNR
jgi:hypothetical protein